MPPQAIPGAWERLGSCSRKGPGICSPQGRRRWPWEASWEPAPNPHPAKPRGPGEPETLAPVEGIPCPDHPARGRGQGHLCSLGLGLPFCLPKAPAGLICPTLPMPVPTAPSNPSPKLGSLTAPMGPGSPLPSSQLGDPSPAWVLTLQGAPFCSYRDPSPSPGLFLGCFSHPSQLNPFATSALAQLEDHDTGMSIGMLAPNSPLGFSSQAKSQWRWQKLIFDH